MPGSIDYTRSNWGTTFRNSVVERRFRMAVLDFDVRQAVRNTLIVSALYSSLLISEIPDFWDEPLFGLVLLGRLAVLGSGFGLAYLIYRTRSTQLIDWGSVGFTLVVSISIVFLLEVHAIIDQRQPHMLTALMAFVMVSMCVWILAPNRFAVQIVATVGMAVVFFGFVLHTSLEYNASIGFSTLLFGIANLVGATIAHRLHELRRTEWAALEVELQTREKLETEIERRRKLEEKLEERAVELQDLNTKLLASKEEADRANRAKSEFLTNMSHELRTPLNAVIGFSQILEREDFGPTNDKQKEMVVDIRTAGEHLHDLISDILDYSKIEAGNFQPSFAPVDVVLQINKSIRFVTGRADEAKVKISVKVPPDNPTLIADERIFKQMLINLLSNSIKFTPSGGSIEVGVSQVEGEGLRVDVKDTGIGIKDDDLATALASFGQIDGSLGRSYDGTGLGLPLVKSFMEMHGGVFEIESEFGVGTTASLVFPLNT